jgi:hypothetical protein
VTGQSVALRADGSSLVAYEDREEYARAAEKRWMVQFAPQLFALKTGFHRACCASLVVRRLLTIVSRAARCEAPPGGFDVD